MQLVTEEQFKDACNKDSLLPIELDPEESTVTDVLSGLEGGGTPTKNNNDKKRNKNMSIESNKRAASSNR